MFVVTVEFAIRPGQAETFLARTQQQARDSLSKETTCRQFDVCVDPQDRRRIFLYELYDDEAAFQQHLKSDHFQSFDAETRDLAESKVVKTWQRTA